MKTTVASLFVAAGLFVAGNAMAVDMPPLAQSNGCIACHAIDHKVLGPAWQDVANKYKGNKKAAAMLVAKIKNGGGGVWGGMAMPPQAAPKADVQKLVKFILGLAK